MIENILKYTKDTFHRYALGKLSAEEFRELKQTLNRENDKALKSMFEEEWEQWQICAPLSVAEKEHIFEKIKQHTQPKRLINWQKQGLRITASIIIILLTSVSVYLYTSNMEMTQLGERNVVVKVGRGERVSVTLPDGTHVRLNSESELSYQQSFGLTDRNVTLTGEGYFDVVKNEGKKFIVNTQFLDIEVLGTAFNIYTYEQADSVEMSLVRGKVLVSLANSPGQKLYVNPNEKVVYNKKTGNMRIESSSNYIETAWVSTELVFRSAPLAEVFNRIGRKYGVTFKVNDPALMNDLYTGVFDEGDIEDVMAILKENFKFDYRIKESTVWVHSHPR